MGRLMIYPKKYRAKGIFSRFHHFSQPLTARLAGGIIPVLLLLACGMIPHNALGQNQGVDAVPLGDSFVFFVDRLNPDLLKVSNTGTHLEGVEVINDPKNADNRVVRFSNSFAHAYTRFFFADAADQGAPRDMSANRDAGNVLSFRILLDTANPKNGTNSDITIRYRLSVQFEDYGPEDGGTTAHNNPFRLRWAIPDDMIDGEWHDVSLTLPPATWAGLEAAKASGGAFEGTPEASWLYAGSWAGFAIGLDLLGPNTAQRPDLWTEFEWDNVESVGIQWDWPGSENPAAPILLDDVFIGPANLDLTGILPAADPPAALSGVNFSVDGNQHVLSWTHDAANTDITQYKVYSSHNPISDIRAQGVGLVATVNATDNGGNHVVRAQGDLPHRSVGSTIYYAVTSADASGLENKDISNTSASLAATSYSPVVVQLTEGQASTIKGNIAAGNVVGSGFPSGTIPFTVNQAHSIRTVGAGEITDSDLSASVLVGYSDAEEIYIYAEVTDDDVQVSPAARTQDGTWQDDSIELVWGNYDVRDAGGSIMGGSPHAEGDDARKRGDYPDYHIRVSAHGTATEAVVKNISDLPGGGGAKLDAGSGAYAPMDGGYKMLLVLPVAEFKDPIDRANAFPAADGIRYSPMSITLNDKHSPGDFQRDTQISWSLRALSGGDNIWKRPAQWQTVAMVGRNYVADAPRGEPEGIPPAHTKILRVDGGPLTVDLDAAFAKNDAAWTVHHYVVDDGPTVETPGASFVVPSLGWVQLDAGMLTMTPTGPGGVKIAVQPGTDSPQPLKLEIMSADAPMIDPGLVPSGRGYNAQSNGYSETVTLTVGKETSKELELFDKFHDRNDIILSYNHSDLQAVVTNPDVITATLDGSKLTITLTDKARGGDASDIWIYAVDPNGEYARLRIGVNITSATGPYVAKALDDVYIHENATTDAKVFLFGTFADRSGDPVVYEVIVNDNSKVEIGANPKIVLTSYMRTEIHNLQNVGPNSTGDIIIKPRSTGSVTFTVKGVAGGEVVEDSFTLFIISKDAPNIKTQIPDQELAADGDPVTISLTDVDPEMEGDQPAFEDPTGGGLTYTASSKNVNVVRAGARGPVLTLSPIWGTGGHTYVTVLATNTNGETFPQTFKVTVKGATLPIVNPQVEPILAAGVTLNPGDDAVVWDLTALPNPLNPEESVGALFLDPNGDPDDPLPGGFLHRMRIEDVETPHRYDDLSTENDVFTSAMRITLDPLTAILTIVPTAPNYANITIWGIDREENMISATMMVTVAGVTSAEDSELPTEVTLAQNYPNPFNPQTTIDYSLPKASDISLIVYDMLGREVEVLVEGPQAAGEHTVRFDANHLPNGTYVYRLVAQDKTITRTMVLLK